MAPMCVMSLPNLWLRSLKSCMMFQSWRDDWWEREKWRCVNLIHILRWTLRRTMKKKKKWLSGNWTVTTTANKSDMEDQKCSPHVGWWTHSAEQKVQSEGVCWQSKPLWWHPEPMKKRSLTVSNCIKTKSILHESSFHCSRLNRHSQCFSQQSSLTVWFHQKREDRPWFWCMWINLMSILWSWKGEITTGPPSFKCQSCVLFDSASS